MEYYTVKEIAELLSVNEETVRRWIRENKLSAERGSGRQGSKVTDEALRDFLKGNKGLVTSVAATTLPGLISGLTAFSTAINGLSWLSILKSKDKDQTDIKVELMEKEFELENLAMNLKTEISSKQHELELVENQITKIKKIISEKQ